MTSNLERNLWVEDEWVDDVRELFSKSQLDGDLNKLSKPEIARLFSMIWAISL
jgi:hypothetical protein